jgi:hypothetical protein
MEDRIQGKYENQEDNFHFAANKRKLTLEEESTEAEIF